MRSKLFVVLLALAAVPALAKSLHWRALDVTARLDRAGVLHVSERQAFVFDGDWNGGERTFNVRAGQSLHFESLTRIDNGAQVPLVAGDLSKVDQYKFPSSTVLRWRSRLPDDPPFTNKEITYVINYSLSGVLRQSGGDYTFDHDFAFPDRAGVIEQFSLRFDLDPVWQGLSSPVVIARNNLTPGQSVVVTHRLHYAGAGSPSGAIKTLPQSFIYVVLTLFALALAFLAFDFVNTERAKGRFAPILPAAAVNEAWLAQHLFVLKPEAAGTAIDSKTDSSEVAAMLARMTVEKKLSSSVETRRTFLKSRQVLCLKLLVPRDKLPDGEAKLVRAFFFSGDTTDTDRIRDHYKSSGFDPSRIVEKAVEPELQRIPGWNKKPQRADFKRDILLLAVALVVAIVAAIRGGNDTGVVIAVIISGGIFFGLASIAANVGSRAVSALPLRLMLPLLILAPFLWLVVAYTRSTAHLVLHFLTPIAICAWATAIVKLLLDMLRSPDSPERIAFRKNLWAARNYFVSELTSPQPRLHDEWYPYLLAFGLGRHVDRWFSAFGSAAAGGTSAFTGSHSSSGSGGSSAPAFTGGGGAFGGAGASGGWAVAAAAIGAGVAAPSSGGGGGGGGGGSSGGGGGGGW